MHMRKKKWAQGELDACPFYYENAYEQRGRWRREFAQDAPLHVELGCGKCVSTARMARENPGVNYLALDLSRDMLAVGRRGIMELYGGEPVENLKLGHHNLLYIQQMLAPEDAVERLYISFCNPWDQKGRHERRRLTHTRQLVQYRTFLTPEAEIYFKTDADGLFCDSREYLEEAGFDVTYITWDLHASGFAPNYVTEHEARFVAQGIPIKFLIAKMRPISAGRERELRAAWLGDEETQAQVLHLDGEGGVIR